MISSERLARMGGHSTTANEQPSRTDVARKSSFVYGIPARLSPLENQRRAKLVSHCPSSFHRPCASEQASIALTVRTLEGSLIHTFVFNLLHRTELQRRWLKSFSHLASSASRKGIRQSLILVAGSSSMIGYVQLADTVQILGKQESSDEFGFSEQISSRRNASRIWGRAVLT